MMQKRQYHLEMEEILQAHAAEGAVPTLLLHSCCAPCSSSVLEMLSQSFSIIDFFYNPNITPAEEYQMRCRELERLTREMPFVHPVRFLEGKYDPETFRELSAGLEEEKEGGERCMRCFTLRLREAAKKAAELGCTYFTTTLTVSPHKDATRINAIGETAAQEYGVAFLPSDFKKKDGYKRSTELSKTFHLYRQNYCGCLFSRREGEG